jgi:uncharacterized membrane protein YfcA
MELQILVPLFALVALVYSSVGFGGGSTYLALLVLAGCSHTSTPKIALVCNLLVVAGGLVHHIHATNFRLRRALPFVFLSVPMAYLGGRIPIGRTTFLVLLGVALAAAGLRLLFIDPHRFGSKSRVRLSTPLSLGIGAALGLLSGLVGIGGGIFLAPILYLSNRYPPKEITGLCSFFILVNSASGLAGQITKDAAGWDVQWILPLAIAVVCGGQVGSRLSTVTMSPRSLQRVTAVLILLVSARIGFLV